MQKATEKSKLGYYDQLAERAKQVCGKASEAPIEESERIILEALKNTALESWKNGIEAGMRKARSRTAKA